ncbi:dihydrodipicolinate synthase [Lachnospiraceae bacterium MD308]|nr:dihydrodipicolinate synthase [Lachnospiraceae bacterium MD308]
MIKLEGIMTALVTPMNEDGMVNEQELKSLIDYQIERKVGSLLILGGTGEYTSMTFEEKCQVIDISVRAAQKRVPVVAGVLDTGIGECLKFSKYCKQAGADALLVCTPYYFSSTQEALVEYYTRVDREVDMPILVYNIPSKTGVNVTPDTMVKLREKMKNLVGIKECAPIGQAIELYLKVGKKINVLTGSEFAAVALMAYGFDGAVMATANVVPDAWVKMYELVKERKINEAMELFLQYAPLFNAIFSENYIGPLKYAMNKAGISCGQAQLLPLIPSKPETRKLVDAQMSALGLTE